MPKGGIKTKKNAKESSAEQKTASEFELEPATKKRENKISPRSSPPSTPASPNSSLKRRGTVRASWKKIAEFLSLFSTVPSSEKIFFAENFRVMVKAGLSISESLETLAMQTKNKKFASILTEIKQGVVEGNTLGSMLQKFPKIFPQYFINMVKVGELSGNLEKNLEELSNQMKKDHDITSKIRGAMIYPAVIVIATVGIGILMFVYVIPSVLSVFDELKIQLPLATRILIAVSKFINHHGILLALIIAGCIVSLIFFARTEKGKKIFHLVLLSLWILGPIIKKVNLARFARTLSSLLKTDIPVIESFKIISTVLGNFYYKNACAKASEELAKGVTVGEILSKSPKLFPPLVTQMVTVGEKAGTLDELLSELAAFYEEEVSDITKNISSIIEPILIIFLGGAVGLIAFAVISPIYSLSQGI